MVIGSLAVNVTANIDKFASNLNRAQSMISKFTRSIAPLRNAVAGVGLGLSAAFSVSSLRASADAIDQLNDTAKKLNIGVEQLSGLGFAAKLSGSSIEDLSQAIQFLEKNLGSDASVFSRIGLDARELKGLRIDETFLRVADAISKMPNNADKMAAAMGVFGKGGGGLLQMLNEGPDKIREMMMEAERLGITINSAQAERVAAANDALDKFGKQWEGLKNQLTIALAPAAEAILTSLTKNLERLITGSDFDNISRMQNLLKPMSDQAFNKFSRGFEEALAKSRTFSGTGAQLRFLRESFGAGAVRPEDIQSLQRAMQMRVDEMAQRVQREHAAREAATRGLPGMAPNAAAGLQKFQSYLDQQLAIKRAFGAIGGALGGASNFAGGQIGNALKSARGLLQFQNMGVTPGFALTQRGTAESYRQQAAIRRESEANKVAKEQVKEAKKANGFLEKIAGAIQPMLPANL